jgi:hypothetical protein
MPEGTAPARGCLRLVLAPFVLLALGFAVAGIRDLLTNDIPAGALRLGLALVFVGVGVIVRLIWQRAESRADPALLTEPWLRRPEWRARRIEDGNKVQALVLGCFALLWNGVSWAAAWSMYATKGVSGVDLVFLLFPLIGLVLLALAVVAFLRWRRYGTSTFELATLPASPGAALAGRVRLSVPFDPPDGFRLTLRCVHVTVTGSGKNRSTREETLWEHSDTMPGGVEERGGINIPIALAIPIDARESDERNSSNRIVWRLLVSADVPGVDYTATFDVPVFRGPAEGQRSPSALSDQPSADEGLNR